MNFPSIETRAAAEKKSLGPGNSLGCEKKKKTGIEGVGRTREEVFQPAPKRVGPDQAKVGESRPSSSEQKPLTIKNDWDQAVKPGILKILPAPI